ncbi:uncharacterized protein LOC126907751 isoform X2 [Daktulosphaira vitifoliae]|uniref:uncharacterized protein LOC126907751 isoform X2 n=1 Tax=Daktulosphaira vitifoliae TaxID=58002 RepID=UPI0021AAEDC1|nr:uncharacterized protein LOC126907751 isoform X2 [Daktulosphaira vitifoliae]
MIMVSNMWWNVIFGIYLIGETTCLFDVSIEIPTGILMGGTAIMRCNYSLEETESLYSVKWYKEQLEFYRYIPKELPHTRVFSYPDINVDISESGDQQVVLRNVTSNLGGKYWCEVSLDAPLFETRIASAVMNVLRPIKDKPVLQVEKTQYSVGEKLRANCTSPSSDYPSNITWFINDRKIKNGISDTVLIYALNKTFSSLDYDILSTGKLKVRCQCDIFDVIHSDMEIVLDEDKPRLASILQPHEYSTGLKASLSVDSILFYVVIFYYITVR